MGTTHTQRAGGSAAGGKSLIFDAEAMVKLLASQATVTTGRGEGMTSSELAEKMGFGQDKVRKLLKRAVIEGKCRATRKTVRTMAGIDTTVTSYVLTEGGM